MACSSRVAGSAGGIMNAWQCPTGAELYPLPNPNPSLGCDDKGITVLQVKGAGINYVMVQRKQFASAARTPEYLNSQILEMV